MTLSRADRRGFATWWWTIDRVAFVLMLALIAIGLMLAFAASPAATGGPLTPGDFRYAAKQAAFAMIAACILAGTSILSIRTIKLTAAIVFAGAVIGSALVLFTGSEVLGAKRWIDFGWMTLQPSEFLKPSFAALAAAILADKQPMRLRKELITFLLILPAIFFCCCNPMWGKPDCLLHCGARCCFAQACRFTGWDCWRAAAWPCWSAHIFCCPTSSIAWRNSSIPRKRVIRRALR